MSGTERTGPRGSIATLCETTPAKVSGLATDMATKSSAAIVGDFHKLRGTARTDALQKLVAERLMARSAEADVPKQGSRL